MTTLAASPDLLPQAVSLLHRHFGFSSFRAPQERVVRSVLAGRDTLAVLPTGAGKSVCFQIPALVLGGLTVVISPLLALMQDQVEAARARGIAARTLNSLLSKADQDRVRGEIGAGEVALLYVAPERCPRLVDELGGAGSTIRLLAIDEAHCIAEWGADFRPSYLKLGRFRQALGGPPAVALTGSATALVRSTIARTLGLGARGGYDLHLASFDRRNLWFGVVPVTSEADRVSRLAEILGQDERVAIVYGATRNTVEALARILRDRGYRASAYHAGLSKAERGRVLTAFLEDRLEVVTATCAFGMGIDKPNVRLVVHWTMPPTPESYYQEAGRAGRDGLPARCLLLHRRGDGDLPRRELSVTFPQRSVVEAAWRDPNALARLPRNVAASVERLRRELRPERGSVRWERVDGRRAAALERIETVERYARERRCRRAALLGYFGERLLRCAGCDVCKPWGASPAAPAAVRDRIKRLRLVLAAGGAAAPWRGPLLDDRTIAVLAFEPPGSVDALAAVPGVGPVVAERLGARILAALAGEGPAPGAEPLPNDELWERLVQWRRERARSLAVPPYRVATDAILRAIAQTKPRSPRALREIRGVGPRFMIVHGAEVLGLIGAGAEPAAT